MEPNTSSLFELQVDHESSAFLRDTARWGKFLAIVGFVCCSIMVLVALFFGSFISSSFGAIGAGYASGIGLVFSIIYIIFAILWFFPCLYLYNFSSKMQAALRNNDQVQLNNSFKNLKSCYRFLGILTLIVICLWALGIIMRAFNHG